MKYLDLLIKSIINPKKFFLVLNKKLFSIPDLNSLNKIKNNFIKKKYFYLWINLAKKNLKFNKLFFQNENKEKKIIFDFHNTNEFNDNFFKSLASNGVVIIENALPDNERKRIQKDFDELKKSNLSTLAFNKLGWLTNPVITETKSKIRFYSKKKYPIILIWKN